MIDDGVETETSEEQADLERRVRANYQHAGPAWFREGDEQALTLNRKAHAAYLRGGLGQLPAGFVSLDASRPWITYWVTHGLALLDEPLPESPSRDAIIAFLASCQHPEGGFGGGPYQLAHLAPTYAAVCTLVTLGGSDALDMVDREGLHSFLLRMCVPPERGGGMTMHEGGEVDVRGCFCAIAACKMLCLEKEPVAAACGMPDFVRRCQSYEGGIGGEPWNEAHGGYTFCGLAAVALIGQAHVLDLERLLWWASQRQGTIEGGFNGRTNKLVDGCYSFWQGALFPLLLQQLQAKQLGHQPGQTGRQPEQQEQPQQEQQQRRPPGMAASAAGAGAAAAEQELGAAHREEAEEAAAARLEAELLDDSSLAEWVGQLAPLGPTAAADAWVSRQQALLDAAVEGSLEAEERYTAAVAGSTGGTAEGSSRAAVLKQEALALLEEAAELQKACERATAYAEAAHCSAAQVLAEAELPSGTTPDGTPALYDAAALQLWLLKCCQGPRGGLRDKPGKPPDYYHSCYCLSGLSSSQHYSGVVLGGPQNLLRKADPLCNVLVEKLDAAQEHFQKKKQQQQQQQQ